MLGFLQEHHDAFAVMPFPAERQLTVEGGRIAAHRHTVHGLLEVDVTVPRQLIREHHARTGEKFSFTAFVIACLGRAIDENKGIHAYRDWRNRLILFDDVDVNTIVQVNVGEQRFSLPHIVRAANHRGAREIHDEIRSVQAKPTQTREFGMRWFLRLPRLARDVFYWGAYRNPHWLKKALGTVGLTAVGMFGKGGGWAIPFGIQTLNVALGGIAEKPWVVNGQIVVRECLSVTLSFDHDVVDGAPAACFVSRFKQLIENGYGLDVLQSEGRT